MSFTKNQGYQNLDLFISHHYIIQYGLIIRGIAKSSGSSQYLQYKIFESLNLQNSLLFLHK